MKINAINMQAVHRAVISDYIYAEGSVSDFEIAKKFNLRLSEVKKIIKDLMQAGLVIQSSKEDRGAGRRGLLFEYNTGNNLVIGIDLGGTKCYGAVITLAGEILSEKTRARHATHGEESCDLLIDFINDLLDAAKSFPGVVRGVGVGVPGVVDPSSGVVEVCPALDWDGFPLKERLNARFNLPVTVENDGNLAALGELWFGLDEKVKNLVLVAIGTGIGAGVVIQGMLTPGAQNLAGEVGYLLPDRDSLNQAYPDFGALEQHVSGTGIAARARVKLAGVLPEEQLKAVTSETVFSAAREGAPWALKVLSETVDRLAQMIAAIQLVVNPEVILLSGGVTRGADLLVAPVLARLEGRIPHLPALLVSRLGYRAGALGAVVKIYRNLAGPFRVIQEM